MEYNVSVANETLDKEHKKKGWIVSSPGKSKGVIGLEKPC